MELTYETLLKAKPVLAKIWHQELPAPTAVNFNRVVRSINSAMYTLEHHRKSLLEKYGTPNEKGEFIVSEDKLNLFNTEFKEILKWKTQLEMPTISHDDLSGMTLTPSEAMLIDFLFD